MTSRDRLTHAIETYASLRSGANAAALNAVIQQVFDELERLQAGRIPDAHADDPLMLVTGTNVVRCDGCTNSCDTGQCERQSMDEEF